jgi:hypothetical protein
MGEGFAAAMRLTDYHAKYFAHDLTRRAATGMDRLSMSLFNAAVDLNPHQIEAALFALESPLSKGVILLFQEEDTATYVRSMLETVGSAGTSTTPDVVPS